MRFVPLFIAIAISQIRLFAQGSSDVDLARLLADQSTRQRGVARILASESRLVPRLLSWTRRPPNQVDRHELFIGLADAFGQLQTKDAIPFLIKNIGIRRWPELNVWLKTDQVIEERLPAVAALVRIGPDASKAVIREYRTIQSDDRIAAIFVVARIADPEAREFLSSVLGQANLERFWANEGLKRLGDRQ